MKVLTHDVPSNGILYADIGLDLTVLEAEDLPLVGLFARCLTQTGTATMVSKELRCWDGEFV